MEQQKAMSKKSKNVQSRQLWFDPDKAGYEKLDPLARRVFNIESQNPGIPVTAIVQLLRRGGWDGADKTIYRLRDEPEYQFLLKEFQKSELENWDDIQQLASQRLKAFLNSKSEKYRMEATKFALSHTREIALTKAKFEFEIEMEKQKIKNPIRHEVRVVLDDAIPVVGESVMAEDGTVTTQAKLEAMNQAGTNQPKPTEPPQEKKQEPSNEVEKTEPTPPKDKDTESQPKKDEPEDSGVIIEGVAMDDV